MKSSILLLAFAALAFSSCTSAYKTGQTPDDVYYSPVEEKDEYVVTDSRDDRSYRGSEEYYEDRYLRYRARDRYRWSALDDYYFNTPYAWHYGSYNNWYSPYSSYHCWNNYYNPYYPGVIIIKNPVAYRPPSRPIAFNPSSYVSNTNTNSKSSLNSRRNSYNNNNSRYNNSNRSSVGNSIRKVFSNSNNNGSGYSNGNSGSTPSRSYTPSSSSSSTRSSSSSSSGSSGGGTISRPKR